MVSQLESDLNKMEVNDFTEAASKRLVEDQEDKVEPLQSNQIENEFDTKQSYLSDATWDDLKIREDIKKNLLEMKFDKPSKIQGVAIPFISKPPYKHFIAQSKNGSGKTGAFLLGMLCRINENEKNLQAVVFGHTRELVNYISRVCTDMTKNTGIVVTNFSNSSKNADLGHIVVTTPGNFEKRLLNDPKKKKALDSLKVLVLDEADYFINTDENLKIFENSCKFFKDNNLNVQLVLFTATINEDNLQKFRKYIPRAVIVQASKESLTLKNVKQMYYVASDKDAKIKFIAEYLSKSFDQERVIIFVNTREGTKELQATLNSQGYKTFILMGGDMDPKERDLTIDKFTKGEIQILITTNVLARGFDEKLVKLIINFDLPTTKNPSQDFYEPDIATYLHRIGRTGRFGGHGIGLTLINSKRNELGMLKKIQDYYESNIEEIKSLQELIEHFSKILSLKFE